VLSRHSRPRLSVLVLPPVPSQSQAFRTGKSFVLDFFLRYLQFHDEHGEDGEGGEAKGEGNGDWMMPAGDTVLEGNQNTLKEGDAQADQSASAQGKGFGWRAGHERNTTGIWVWSKPFIRTLPDSGGEKVAVLVMDTQGMFDGTLSQQLTASIFGLSTLFRCEQREQRE